MTLQKVDDILARISNGYAGEVRFYGEAQNGTNQFPNASTQAFFRRMAYVEPFISPLPSGVSAYLPVEVAAVQVAFWQGLLVTESIVMGTYNIGTGVFTDGAVAPTRSELGVSRQIPVSLVAEVTTAITGTPSTSLTIQYTDAVSGSGVSSPNIFAAGAANAILKSASPIYAVAAGTSPFALDVTGVTYTPNAATGVLTIWGVIPVAYVPAMSVHSAVDDLIVENTMLSSLSDTARLDVWTLGNVIQGGAVAGYIRYVGDT